jgi:hypothetical protein
VIGVLQVVQKSICISQLHLKDSVNFNETLMYKLSEDATISKFKKVLLFASKQDLYTPFESALVLPSESKQNIYGKMQENMLKNIAHNMEQFQVVYPGMDPEWGWNYVLGREAHIAMLSQEAFLEIAVYIFNYK